MPPALHTEYRLRNTRPLQWPYPHVIVEDVFPWPFFEQVRAHLPSLSAYKKLGETGRVSPGSYPQRHVCYFALPEYREKMTAERAAFWSGVSEWLLGNDFMRAMLDKFAPVLSRRFAPGDKLSLRAEACLMQDHQGYGLGPHTDSPRKVISALFYLPDARDAWDAKLHGSGTSLYVPKDRSFTCPGGPHHAREGFDRVHTAPFRPNTLFAFGKSDVSFHGVEPVGDGVVRELLLYDVFIAQ